ncbi:hypothetical protein M9R32_09185 [Paenisporosarcina quisquiliarum]|uniref:Uncharacterized protein n=1 Tax=Paenisporosarcina quisquiliarum TaxID=365346 RepID=A0A9X3LG61_9BACL|nr:hypothetical protein [Paenisporosarcina quisquiliarum]MCZ8537352.1 hypothetical protein [Paenisporosarcina quisquiliarum]
MPQSFSQMKINSDEFNWSNEEGLLKYNEVPTILIWYKSLEILLMTMDELTGIEKTNDVLQAFGFRLGQMVGQNYSGRNDLENILIEYSDLYRNAGWGNVKISTFSKEEKRVVLELHNSWEKIVFKNLSKEQESIILPNLWAGLMSELLQENMEYKLLRKSSIGDEYEELQMFAQ